MNIAKATRQPQIGATTGGGFRYNYTKNNPSFRQGIEILIWKNLAWGHEYLKALPDDKKSQT
jgi:hypothetical protein